MDMTRVSCCTYPLRERPITEAMDVIASAGFCQLDVLGTMPHLSLDPRECDPEALLSAAQARGLRIANLGTYAGREFASDDPAAQERELQQLRRAIDLAAMFGARSIRVRAGKDDQACIQRIVPWFRQGAAYAAERGVYMGVENHGGGISGNPRLCVELAEQVGSPYFGVLYEPCNLMQGGVDYRDALEIVRDHIVHVHLKDGAVTERGFSRTMLGEGQIHMRWVVDQLAALGYQGTLALEYELPSPPPEVGLKQWYDIFQSM